MSVKSEILAELYIAIRENAIKLREEAHVMFDATRFSRSYALGHMACEEFAKLPIILGLAGDLASCGNPEWKKTWKRLKSHEAKNTIWGIVPYVFTLIHHSDGISEDLRRLGSMAVDAVKHLDGRKIGRDVGLYVELREGAVCRPDALITADDAVAVMKVAAFVQAWDLAKFGDIDQLKQVIATHPGRDRIAGQFWKATGSAEAIFPQPESVPEPSAATD